MIRNNSCEFEGGGRVLRLKQYMPADANQAHIEAVLDALEVNDRVEALYIQNFEKVSHESSARRTNVQSARPLQSLLMEVTAVGSSGRVCTSPCDAVWRSTENLGTSYRQRHPNRCTGVLRA